MDKAPYRLILASQSPRRRELLSHLQLRFDVYPPDIDENLPIKDPEKMVHELSRQKACKIWSDHHRTLQQSGIRPLILAADTTVALNGAIFNKPDSVSEARQMLLKLSGQTHQVFTGFTLKAEHVEVTKVCRSLVTFAPIDEETLTLYLSGGESLDKAGAYGIQGQGLMFITSLQGSYSNVVGLPLSDVLDELKKISFDPARWRKSFESL
jgi:septum formation protein